MNEKLKESKTSENRCAGCAHEGVHNGFEPCKRCVNNDRAYEDATDNHYEVERMRLFKDGAAWCITGDDFVNLRESPAGFGDTADEALADYRKHQKIAIDKWLANHTEKKNNCEKCGGQGYYIETVKVMGSSVTGPRKCECKGASDGR